MTKSTENPIGSTLQQTMLRIKDPKISISFYCDHFGFKLLHKYDFPDWKFSLYFLGILKEGQDWPEIEDTKATEKALWTMPHGMSCLELTHNWGSENDKDFVVNNGNIEPNRGFGHIAVMTPDVYAASEELLAQGVNFQKKPDEGRMKGLAFAKDPDGYWIEIVKRGESSEVSNTTKYSLAQTMLRIKDPSKSITFYRDVLKMTLLKEIHFGPDKGNFSLYFLASIPPGQDVPDAKASDENEKNNSFITNMYSQVLELTHNHGTEKIDAFSYHDGNTENKEKGIHRGFGHIGFLVDDLKKSCKYFDESGVKFKKRPEEGAMRGLAFLYDPDGYAVEIIQKGMAI